MVSCMEATKARLRRAEARRREADVIFEAVRRRGQTPDESLRALAAHNAAVLKMNKAKR
jgi:hypothetical protein